MSQSDFSDNVAAEVDNSQTALFEQSPDHPSDPSAQKPPTKTEPIRHILDAIGRYRKHSRPISQSGPPKVEDMKARDERLKEVASTLKNEFAGLDAEIDRILQVIRPWFVLPQAQRRPLVVSLWGMTGVGKTSLVRRLSELLDISKIYEEFDLGQYTGDSQHAYPLVGPRLWRFSGQPCLLFFDELHTVRTMGMNGEIDRPQLRDLWTLMDSGIVPVVVDSHRNMVNHLRSSIKMAREMPDSHTTHLTDVHQMDQVISYIGLDIEADELGKIAERNRIEAYEWFIEEIQWIMNSAKSLDYRQSLIFVAGNLDELFKSHGSVNPDDMNADDLFEKTKQIGVDQLREALLSRFRPEQVGRLGSIQIIFPSLSPKSLRKIIRTHLDVIGNWIHDGFGVQTKFSDSVVELVFREGVIPSQGARPVLSTLKELIETRVADWLLEALQNGVTELEIEFSAKNKMLSAKGRGKSEQAVNVSARILTREERLPEIKMSEEFKNLLAVHEAGHAVVGIASQGVLPVKTLAGPLSWHRGGPRVVFPNTEFLTKELCLAMLDTLLAGLVAEETVFGKANTSLGVERDIQQATMLAAQMITMNAMGDHIGCSVASIDQPLNIHALRDDDDELKERWLSEAKQRAADVLKKQWALFQAITQALLTKDRLTSGDMKELVSQHFVGSREEIRQIVEGKKPAIFDAHSSEALKKVFARKPARLKKAS